MNDQTEPTPRLSAPTPRLTPSLTTLATLAVGFTLIIVALMGARPGVRRVTVYAGAYPPISVSELVAKADAIALVRPTGEDSERWNSADGRAWTSDDREHPAYIYRDEDVTVVKVLRGTLAEGALVVRQVGGEADGVRMHFEDDPDWQPDSTYLAFLREYETPTQTGTERRWTILWQDRGVFSSDGRGGWTNTRSGEAIARDELATLADR